MSKLPRLLVFVSALVGAPPAGALADATDPPSLALPTDRASAAPRFLLAATVRAPFDRAYGLAVGFAPVGHLALEVSLDLDESKRVSLLAGAVLRPLGRRNEGLLLRTALGLRTPTESSADDPVSLTARAVAGASTVVRGTYVEATAGTTLRREAASSLELGFLLECRLGFVF